MYDSLFVPVVTDDGKKRMVLGSSCGQIYYTVDEGYPSDFRFFKGDYAKVYIPNIRADVAPKLADYLKSEFDKMKPDPYMMSDPSNIVYGYERIGDNLYKKIIGNGKTIKISFLNDIYRFNMDNVYIEYYCRLTRDDVASDIIRLLDELTSPDNLFTHSCLKYNLFLGSNSLTAPIYGSRYYKITNQKDVKFVSEENTSIEGWLSDDHDSLQLNLWDMIKCRINSSSEESLLDLLAYATLMFKSHLDSFKLHEFELNYKSVEEMASLFERSGYDKDTALVDDDIVRFSKPVKEGAYKVRVVYEGYCVGFLYGGISLVVPNIYLNESMLLSISKWLIYTEKALSGKDY